MLGILKNLKRKNIISTFNVILIYFFLLYLKGRLITAYGKLSNNILEEDEVPDMTQAGSRVEV